MESLATTERKLVGVFRLYALGQDCWPLAFSALTRWMGRERGGFAHALFLRMFACLAESRRRRLRVGPPGCPQVTTDERAMLALLTCAHDGRPDELALRSQWLVRAPGEQRLGELAIGLAHALDMEPNRSGSDPEIAVPELRVGQKLA